MTNVNRMVAVAIQRGQHAIAKMLENAYRDNCNYPVTTGEQLREIEEELSGFMHEHEYPIKAITCTGKKDPSRTIRSRMYKHNQYIARI